MDRAFGHSETGHPKPRPHRAGAGGRTQYLLADGLGSVVRVNDHTLGTVATYRYDPFGNATRVTGDPGITPFRYAGYHLDATGLYKTGERYYDPALGRFTQQDPLHDPFDPKLWNRYVYVGNDPVNFTDPTGWDACPAVSGRTEGFVAGVATIGSFIFGAGSCGPLW